jgi:hypothetical protein
MRFSPFYSMSALMRATLLENVKTPAAVAVSLAALLLPARASAHFVLTFDPQTATPGDTVEVGFADRHVLSVNVFLIPLEAARKFKPPPLRAPVDLVSLGRLGNGGRLSFVVPEVPAGRYTTVLRREDGHYLASTQPQLPVGVDPTGFDAAPDPAVLEIVGDSSRETALLLVLLGVLLLGALLAVGVVVHRRWHDAVSG